jgi:hypothetical protein
MSASSGVEQLSDSRYVVLILRLLVDKRGRVVHGEVGGADGGEEEHWVRFRGADGLVGAVQAWLSSSRGAW